MEGLMNADQLIDTIQLSVKENSSIQTSQNVEGSWR